MMTAGENSDAPGMAQGLHLVAKPIGAACNFDCAYCFYLEKQALYADGEDCRMPDEMLGAFIRSYISSQPTPVVECVWQGGEPTLWGLDFFRRVVEFSAPSRNSRPSPIPCRPMARSSTTRGAAS